MKQIVSFSVQSLKPRTADVSSDQFVEIVLEVRATPQYPKEPPFVALVDSKGLDQQRQKHLLNHIESKANELSPGLMLVALCESVNNDEIDNDEKILQSEHEIIQSKVPDSTTTKEPDEVERQVRYPPAVESGKHVSGTSNGPSSSGNRNFGARRHRLRSDNHSSSTARHPRKSVQQQQWVRRDNPSNNQ
ncbi:RING-type E3 ubiquitin transferase [Trifolium repens]|nr:RING-type E3 ubiquitin transferase [Trifolium repens]